jgi:hypothetical protein
MRKKRFLYIISILLIVGFAIFTLKKSNTVSYNNENHHLYYNYYGVSWYRWGGDYQTEKLYQNKLQKDVYYCKIWASQGNKSRWVQLNKGWWGYEAKDIDSTLINFKNCIEMEPIELINKWDAFQYLYRD